MIYGVLCRKAALGGVIHLYDISETPPSFESVPGNVLMFDRKLGRNAGLSKVVMLISKWEGLGEEKFARQRREVLDRWRTIISPHGNIGTGVRIERWESPAGGKGNAKDIIESCLRRVMSDGVGLKVNSRQPADDPALLDARATDIVIP